MEIDDVEYEELKAAAATNVESAAKIKEFRDSNIALKQTLEGFDGVDIEIYKKLKADADAIEKKELIASGDVEALIAKERADADKRIEALNGRVSELTGTITAMTVTDRLKAAAGDVGARAEAIDDLVRSVGGEWELRDGVPVHVKNGEVILSAKNAGENMGMPEFFSGVAVAKPFYFGGSHGAEGEEGKKRGDGVQVVTNTPENLGKYSKEIREGKVIVESLQSQALAA